MARPQPPSLVALAAALVLAAAGPAGAVVDVSGPARGLAVAPFLGSPSDGARPDGVPDLAAALAEAIRLDSQLRVVAPAEIRRDERGRTESAALPPARDVRRWALWNQVENVVVGRREGSRAAVELRSGHSGGALAEYRLAPASPEELPGAVRRLARLILADLGEGGATLTDTLPPVSAAAVGASVTPAAPEPAPAEVSGADRPAEDQEADSLSLIPGAPRDDPISINSDELEVLPEAGGRRLVFSRNVEVLRGDVTLNADRLEAVYPQGASQPNLLQATGHVRVHQGDRRARCEQATYERAANTIVCRGKAEVTQGCDRARGQEIEFDLGRDRVRVSGAASVLIQSEAPDEACPDGSAPVRPPADAAGAAPAAGATP